MTEKSFNDKIAKLKAKFKANKKKQVEIIEHKDNRIVVSKIK